MNLLQDKSYSEKYLSAPIQTVVKILTVSLPNMLEPLKSLAHQSFILSILTTGVRL